MGAIYYAKVDDDGLIERVQVTTRAFIDAHPERYPGTWVETADPYAEPGEVAYCGPGDGFADNLPQRFAPQWVQPQGADVEGTAPYPENAVVWHNGRLWRSTTPNNVWEPGVSAWHDQPTGGQPPQWVQPTGAHDAYRADVKVTHDGTVWQNTHGDGNSWEPGVYGWTEITG